MTADGVLPSNEGRGYVLRRLLRRAARHGRLLGIEGNFMTEVCKVVIENSGKAYPELVDKKDHIFNILNNEESRFAATIDTGLSLLKQKIEEIKAQEGEDILGGADSFKLYDTYGFPVELMEEILEEQGMTMDMEAFKAEMQKQKERARNARATDTYMGADETVFNQLDPAMSTEFVGYTDYSYAGAKVLAIVSNDAVVDTASEGDKVSIVVDKTPFYAEMGGQVGDCGTMHNDNCNIKINDCVKFGGNKFIHTGVVENGQIKVGDTIDLDIDVKNRMDIARNHTATHILQAALREVLGSHIEQAGSYVSKDRLRFDFTHFEAISKEDLARVEHIVNEKILASIPVKMEEMPMEEAKKLGAMALFGEKYGDVVRVVSVGDYSVEFCGGTHISNSSQIGSFKIISETGVAAGTRAGVLNHYEDVEFLLNNIFGVLRTNFKNIISKIEHVLEENKQLSSELESLKSKLSGGLVDEIIAKAEDVNGFKYVSAKVSGIDMNALRNMGDQIKEKSGEGVIVLASDVDGKVNFVVMCSDEAVKKGAKAGNIVKAAATVCGGGGGGRPNMAQAGGKDPSKIDEALATAKTTVEDMLK